MAETQPTSDPISPAADPDVRIIKPNPDRGEGGLGEVAKNLTVATYVMTWSLREIRHRTCIGRD